MKQKDKEKHLMTHKNKRTRQSDDACDKMTEIRNAISRKKQAELSLATCSDE